MKNKLFKTKSYFVLLVVTLLLLVVTFGINYFKDTKLKSVVLPTLTPISITDWKIYKDEIYKFSFRHPEDWIVEKSPIGNSPTSKFKHNMYPYLLDVSTGVGDNYSSITINPEGGSNSNLNSSMKSTQFVLDDRSANLYKFIPDTGFWFINLNEGDGYPNFSIGITYPDKNIQIVNTILSTFKFTK